MRARFVNENISFERGQDVKDALNVGYENARIFNKALSKREYFQPVLEPMIKGLEEGSVKERDAIRFIDGAIHKYHPRRIISWYEWYEEDSHLFWDKDRLEFNITFNMPEIEWFQITKYPKLICQLGENDTFIHDRHFLINSRLRVTQDDGSIEDLFSETNMFYPGDEIFKMPAVIHNINKVVETAIKNLY